MTWGVVWLTMLRLKQLFIVVPPLLLAVLEMFHAHGHHDAVFETIRPQISAWMIVHYLQLLLFPLTAFSVLQLNAPYRDWMSRIAAIAMIVFGIGYASYDSIAGIGTGVLIADAIEFEQVLGDTAPASYRPIIAETVQAYYHSPSVGNIAVIAIAAAIIGFVFTAIRIIQVGHGYVGNVAVIWLGIACWGVTHTHAPPYGPVTYLSVFAATVSIVVLSPKRAEVLGYTSAEAASAGFTSVNVPGPQPSGATT